MFGNHFGCPNLWQLSPLFLFSITNFCLLLCLIESPQRADATIQVLSAEQANKMAKKMVDGAMEMMRQKYRLERGWRAENAAGNGSEWAATEEEKMAAEEKRQRRRKKKHQNHHHHHHHSHHPEEQDDEAAVVVPGADGGADSSNGVPATALKYGNEEVMKRAKARGKELIEALGVKGDEEVTEKRGTPMTMKSLFGKFTRRD